MMRFFGGGEPIEKKKGKVLDEDVQIGRYVFFQVFNTNITLKEAPSIADLESVSKFSSDYF